jgi:hypothetical protein
MCLNGHFVKFLDMLTPVCLEPEMRLGMCQRLNFLKSLTAGAKKGRAGCHSAFMLQAKILCPHQCVDIKKEVTFLTPPTLLACAVALAISSPDLTIPSSTTLH